MMKISAGCAIIYNNKILFCHPTNSEWCGTYSPPKGGVNEKESLIDAAIRETKEEVGITITYDMILNADEPIEVSYIKKNDVFKKVYIYVVVIKSLSEINLISEIVPKKQLQLEEVDWAGFIDAKEIEKRVFYRFVVLKDFLK